MFRPELAPLKHSSRGQSAALRPLLQVLSAVLCLSTAAAACGGDDSDENTEASTGAGGTAAGSGGGGTGGATTPPPPMPVACGAIMCYPPTSPLSGILSMFGGALGGVLPTPQACCLDDSAGTCGVNTGGSTTCEALANTDTRCPKADLGMIGGFINIAPCCIDNQCGQDGKIFGLGCVQNSEVMTMLGPLAGGMFQLPPTVACDAPPMQPTTGPDAEDAGAPDDIDAGT